MSEDKPTNPQKIKIWGDGIQNSVGASSAAYFGGVAVVGTNGAVGAATAPAAASPLPPIPIDRTVQLAAKAAGFTNRLGWAPRDDDAQAFELAVVLGMTVIIDRKAGETHVSRGALSTMEKHFHDARKATRNAITTLAAFIGVNASEDGHQ